MGNRTLPQDADLAAAEQGRSEKASVRDVTHLILVGCAFVVSITTFFIIRSAVVPSSFGRYGHYRAAALDEIRARPVSFAGQDTCIGCHDAVATVRSQGKHKSVACEGCHGPQAKHADDPMTIKPQRPNAATLCVRCHEKIAARPQSFPQVVSAEHSGGETCTMCHQAHKPAL